MIGGSLGLSESVLKRADYKLSFSRMTFPHQLMQMILLEQIYRSYRIMNHEPYHKMNECTNKSKRKKKTMNTEKFEEFISQYPIFEYRILDTKDITIQERVRTICQEECERYDSTWACPPAVGTLQECEKKIKSYPQAVFFSSVAEVLDIMNMEEMLSTKTGTRGPDYRGGKYLK